MRLTNLTMDHSVFPDKSSSPEFPELRGFTKQETRRGRQADGPDLDGFVQEEVCEVTGFESRVREECQVRQGQSCQGLSSAVGSLRDRV